MIRAILFGLVLLSLGGCIFEKTHEVKRLNDERCVEVTDYSVVIISVYAETEIVKCKE